MGRRSELAGFGAAFALIPAVLAGFSSSPAAQTCFAYVDGIDAKAPLQCVRKTDLMPPCSWPSDCTSIPSSSSQTNLLMHTRWHECFGNVGGASPPPGRGQRWYAFHRQFEYDFNIWRMSNFASTDPLGRGSPIESIEWCPPQDTDNDGVDDTYTNLRVGHDGAGMPLSAACGAGDPRPWNTDCHGCEAFPQCMFRTGAGPMSCPNEPDSLCARGGVSFPHTALEQFDNVDDISLLLDDYFHGDMHEAVSDGDFANWGPLAFNNDDCANPNCSPRDPMFWRLHKALDDIVRAWQDLKAVDLMLVIDTSGSMSETDASGKSKLERALEAAEYFAELLEDTRPDGQQNRLGIVTYDSTPTVALGLTGVGPGFRDPGSPFATAIDAIRSAGPGGCTGIGGGIEAALAGAPGSEGLCPNGGDCRLNATPAPPGTNARKAILLLTDGLENRPPCLNSADTTPGGGCGTICRGPTLQYDDLEFTQLVALGYGNGSSLNSELLTLLAERQGGIYALDPNGAEDDLKYFFTMAFGRLTDEFVFVDPRGQLAAAESATPPVEYSSCKFDSKLTFTSGWKDEITPGDLELLVTDPKGNLVQTGQPGVESSSEPLWAFHRVGQNHDGVGGGTWRAQLVRPHGFYVNGFAPDAFAEPDEGTMVVRRQIQRLCPDGCRRVLFFEKGRQGARSAYADALDREIDAGLIADVEATEDPGDFANLLPSDQWDLIVYARMGPEEDEPYDGIFASLLCEGQRAILTDTREGAASHIFECARVRQDGNVNWEVLEGDGLLFEGALKMANPGHPIATYGLAGPLDIQATADGGKSSAVLALVERGQAHTWFLDVLGQGLGNLSPVLSRPVWRTGESLRASTRILPSNMRAGGYDHVDARVEVTYPTVGIGTLLAKQGLVSPPDTPGESLDPRTAAIAALDIPTSTAIFPLFDDGTHGDLTPGNAQWSAILDGMGTVDGTYHMRYIVDLSAEGCTTRRELAQAATVVVRTEPEASNVRVRASLPTPDGGRRTVVTLTPADRYGNLVGPGITEPPTCEPNDACRVEGFQDLGEGSYEIAVVTAASVAGVRLHGFDAAFDIPIPCPNCPRIASVDLPARTVFEHSSREGTIHLTEPVPDEGSGYALVHLSSSDPMVAQVPDSVLVKAGERSATFPIQALDVRDEPAQVRISARYGNDVHSQPLTVKRERAVESNRELRRREHEGHGRPRYEH